MNALTAHVRTYQGALTRRPTEPRLTAALTAIADKTGLTKMHEPLAHVADDGTYTSIVMIAESHIAIDGKHKAAFCIVWSCQEFDELAVRDTLTAKLPGVWRLIDAKEYVSQ